MNPNAHSFFDSIRLGQRRLSNRFVVAPMTRVSATSDGIPTDSMADYYEAFATGGFAAIITEGIYTDSIASVCNPNQPGLVTEQQVKSWLRLTTRVRQYPTVFIAQLMHAGALSQVLTTTLAPSAIPPIGKPSASSGGLPTFTHPKEMTVEDIKTAIRGYVKAGLNAVEAGFDGIEIHGANGYLPDQFLTTYTNQRTDRYGGSVENRFHFIAELMHEIRAAVPNDFIVGLRLSEGKVNNLTYRWEEGAEMARAVFAEVKKAAPDYLHLAAEGGGWQRECVYADGSSSTGIARQMLDCPVIANGGLHDLSLANKILTEELGDLLAIGRYAIANPDFPQKVFRQEPLLPFESGMIKPSVSLENTREWIGTRMDRI
ncbi:NADH:flavin oxidoreductase [Larkinella rosea]|uniref:NADH:flavin oxidoreductase n=1 Tax=Larkinella rosea TaxID=2025312 RepID=A0A3P1C078_9BACT|nr:NADH:flavin oxidoreductase [Larkinella rosea]RRB06815.1 NADH:flavin oxidoreductase [Larkinella rosea]